MLEFQSIYMSIVVFTPSPLYNIRQFLSHYNPNIFIHVNSNLSSVNSKQLQRISEN